MKKWSARGTVCVLAAGAVWCCWLFWEQASRLYYEHFVYPHEKVLDDYLPNDRWQDYAFLFVVLTMIALLIKGIVRLRRVAI